MSASGLPRARQGLRARLVRNTLLLASGNGGAALLSLGVVTINSRALSLTEFGIYVLLQTSGLLIAGLFAFATQQPVIKLGTAALESGDRPRFERVLGMGFLADTMSAGLAATTAVVLTLSAGSVIGLPTEYTLAAVIVSISLILQGFRTSEGVFRVYDRFDLLGLSQVAGAATQLVTAIALAWWQAPFISYAILIAIGFVIPVLIQLIAVSVLLRRQGIRPRLQGVVQARADRREFVAYCWTTGAMGTCEAARQYGDSPLVGALISVEAAGIYNVAKQLAGVLRKGAAIYNSILFPELATYMARDEIAAARRILRKVLVLSAAVGGATVLVSAFAGGFALRTLFGPDFVEGHLVLVLLCGATGLQLIGATYSMYVQAFVGPTALLRAYIPASIAYLGVVFALTPTLGLPGAGLAQIGFFAILALLCRSRLRSLVAFGARPT